jgi:hypothetical protein
MKKAIKIFFTVIFILSMLTSCSQKPTEIKLSDLVTACDYLEAMEKCFDAKQELKKEVDELYDGNIKNVPKEIKEYANKLKRKQRQIGKALQKKYTEAEWEECESYERIDAKIRK